MATKIGVSTGVFYKYFKEEELNQMISFLKNVDIDIIEILYVRPFMLDVKISDENMAYLSTKDVLIHSPFFVDKGYKDIFYDKLLIEKLIEKQELLKAKHIILHPDLLPNFDLINRYQKVFVFENLKEERKYSLKKLLDLIDSGMRIKISLDIGHLKDIDRSDIFKIMDKHKNNLAEIQLSIKEDYEDFLTGNINRKYSFLIGLNIPLILETRPKELSHLNIILQNLRNFLKND